MKGTWHLQSARLVYWNDGCSSTKSQLSITKCFLQCLSRPGETELSKHREGDQVRGKCVLQGADSGGIPSGLYPPDSEIQMNVTVHLAM